MPTGRSGAQTRCSEHHPAERYPECAILPGDSEQFQTGANRIGCHEPEGFPAFEIVYTLAPEAWGKGYAREGAGAALRYAREVLGRTGIASIIRPANSASIRVAQALGAVGAETVEFFGAPSVLYRYPAE